MDDLEKILSENLSAHQTVSISVIPTIMAILALILNIAFAIAVFKDATMRKRQGQTLWFVPPIFWAGVSLVGSFVGAALYWAMHYSALVGSEPPTNPDSSWTKPA